MTTAYFTLRKPLTDISTALINGHIRVTLFINHANAGTLTVRTEELPELLSALSYGGEDLPNDSTVLVNGLRVAAPEQMPDDTCLISEKGIITTLAEVREAWKKGGEH